MGICFLSVVMARFFHLVLEIYHSRTPWRPPMLTAGLTRRVRLSKLWLLVFSQGTVEFSPTKTHPARTIAYWRRPYPVEIGSRFFYTNNNFVTQIFNYYHVPYARIFEDRRLFKIYSIPFLQSSEEGFCKNKWNLKVYKMK